MKTKLPYFLSAFFLMLSMQLYAQTIVPDTVNKQIESSVVAVKEKRQLNFFKINLFGIPFKNYSLQYERALTKRFSVAISYRIMPGLPFEDKIAEELEGDVNTDNLKVEGSAITPEIRLYLGKKGYGRGFYFAPFYRRATFEMSDLAFFYEDDNGTNGQNSINLSGKFTSNTGGLMMGAQWALGKYICLDWWILGAHYGTGTGNFLGLSSRAFTQSEQEDIRAELEDLEIPSVEKTVTVNANSAALKLDGPWGGIRGGLSLGFKF